MSATDESQDPCLPPTCDELAREMNGVTRDELLGSLERLESAARNFADVSLRVFSGYELELALNVCRAIRDFAVAVRPPPPGEGADPVS